jgi:predicted nucleic acid-binding protein
MLVVDASVAVKWFVQEPATVDAVALLGRNDTLIAPELVVAEVVNVLWKHLMRAELERRQVAHVPAALSRTFSELWPVDWLARRALEIAAELRHPAYDCFYLALAESKDVPLVTADRRLIARLAGSPWQARCRPLGS